MATKADPGPQRDECLEAGPRKPRGFGRQQFNHNSGREIFCGRCETFLGCAKCLPSLRLSELICKRCHAIADPMTNDRLVSRNDQLFVRAFAVIDVLTRTPKSRRGLTPDERAQQLRDAASLVESLILPVTVNHEKWHEVAREFRAKARAIGPPAPEPVHDQAADVPAPPDEQWEDPVPPPPEE